MCWCYCCCCPSCCHPPPPTCRPHLPLLPLPGCCCCNLRFRSWCFCPSRCQLNRCCRHRSVACAFPLRQGNGLWSDWKPNKQPPFLAICFSSTEDWHVATAPPARITICACAKFPVNHSGWIGWLCADHGSVARVYACCEIQGPRWSWDDYTPAAPAVWNLFLTIIGYPISWNLLNTKVPLSWYWLLNVIAMLEYIWSIEIFVDCMYIP